MAALPGNSDDINKTDIEICLKLNVDAQVCDLVSWIWAVLMYSLVQYKQNIYNIQQGKKDRESCVI